MKVVIIKKAVIIVIVIALVLTICFFNRYTQTLSDQVEPKKIAIIIDDFGNNGEGTDDMLKIKEHLTVAVMPNSPYSINDAERAHKKGLEVIIHLPMEPIRGKKSWLPPDSITSDLSLEEVLKRTRAAFDQIPYAVGFNNHMGSKISTNRDMMYVILKEAKKRDFFVLDSRTVVGSVIDEVSQDIGINHYDRDMFIDSKSEYEVYKQVLKLAEISEEKGYAIGIGHVGPAGGKITARGIEDALPELKKRNIELVYVSQIKQGS